MHSMILLRPLRFVLILLALLSVAGCYLFSPDDYKYYEAYERTDRGGGGGHTD